MESPQQRLQQGSAMWRRSPPHVLRLQRLWRPTRRCGQRNWPSRPRCVRGHADASCSSARIFRSVWYADRRYACSAFATGCLYKVSLLRKELEASSTARDATRAVLQARCEELEKANCSTASLIGRLTADLKSHSLVTSAAEDAMRQAEESAAATAAAVARMEQESAATAQRAAALARGASGIVQRAKQRAADATKAKAELEAERRRGDALASQMRELEAKLQVVNADLDDAKLATSAKSDEIAQVRSSLERVTTERDEYRRLLEETQSASNAILRRLEDAALVTACGGAMQAQAAIAADAPAACENLVPVLGDSDPESGHERDRINAPDAIAADASPAKRQRLMSD